MAPLIPANPDITDWQTKYNAKDSQDADSKRTDNIFLLFFVAILISSVFATTFIWFYHGNSLTLWLGDNGILVAWLFIAISLVVISLLSFSLLLKSASRFFVELYRPPKDILPGDRIRLRFFGVPPVPPPLDKWMHYPSVIIKDGKVDPKGDWITWLGGPARLVIYDGSAAYVERGKRFSRVIGPATHSSFLDPTETVKAVVDLQPQVITKQGSKPGGVKAWTKDGIQVQMDVRMECQIALEGATDDNNKGLLFPYGPISVKKAIEKVAVRYDSVNKVLAESDWADGVWGQVQGKLSTYVFSHTLDELFLAEKAAGQLQSQEVANKMLQELNLKLNEYGGRIISLQIKNLTPVSPIVNEQRLRNWEAKKQSASVVSKGQAEAYRILTVEKARAEAESDLIDAIAEGLRSTDPSRYDEQLVLSLSGILDQSLNDTELTPYIPGETLDSLKKLRDLLGI